MIRRITKPVAIVIVALFVFATPALASLVVQNFMQADITAAEPCFFKAPGDDTITYNQADADADDPFVGFDAAQTTAVDGANLVEETLSIRGMIGDRIMYTDVVRYQNTCDVPLDIQLLASVAGGNWNDRSAAIYLSSASDTIGAADAAEIAPAGRPGDIGEGSGWDAAPIVVNAGGVIGNDATGIITLAPGQELRGAVVISSGTTASPEVGTVNWTAEATNSNDG